ncbi:MAG: bifunctional phosphoribosyl-AMP cyclohydrolase/phosphoribosyl-ATP diphosphatase HisIE [Gemmatimonadales bacterium]|jgi:phosphoribosyl-ATP pyrophosphohydrolase/phosphoribosyl-AMP cyclohydrolase
MMNRDAPLRFDPKTNLIPAIVQDARSGRVLMLGYMNRDALERTRETGRVTFFSRSRKMLWEKGETSGNWLELVDILPDCDADALLVRAVPHGPTCHTGDVSCFGELDRPGLGEILADLYELIEERKRERPDGSYTTRLFDGGASAIGRKVAEEALELTLEAVTAGSRADEEAADLFYHTLVLLVAMEVSPEDVAHRLVERRRGR